MLHQLLSQVALKPIKRSLLQRQIHQDHKTEVKGYLLMIHKKCCILLSFEVYHVYIHWWSLVQIMATCCLFSQWSATTWTIDSSLQKRPNRMIFNGKYFKSACLRLLSSSCRTDCSLMDRIPIILGLYSLRRRRLISIGISIINLRRSSDRLRFIMGIPIPVRRRLLSE